MDNPFLRLRVQTGRGAGLDQRTSYDAQLDPCILYNKKSGRGGCGYAVKGLDGMGCCGEGFGGEGKCSEPGCAITVKERPDGCLDSEVDEGQKRRGYGKSSDLVG
jgi:hypothetical protein